MFVLDMPNVPPESAPLMIAQANQSQQGIQNATRSVGVCHIVNNMSDNTPSAENVIETIGEAIAYFRLYEHRKVTGAAAQVTLLEKPSHGILRDGGDGAYEYLPNPGYFGKDRAVVLVDIAGVQVKVVYFFQSLDGPIGNTTYERLCGNKGETWKISSASEVQDDQSNIEQLVSYATGFATDMGSWFGSDYSNSLFATPQTTPSL